MLKKIIYISFLSLFFGVLIFAQNTQKINDLKYKIQIENNANKKAEQLIELSKLLSDYDYYEALNYAYEGLTLSKSLHYNKGKVASYYQIAIIEQKEGNFKKAIDAVNLANEISESYGDQKGMANANLMLGDIHIDMKDFDGAKIYIQYANDIGQKIKSKSIIAKSNASFGKLSSAQGKNYLAAQYYEMSAEEISTTYQYEEIGQIYYEYAKIQMTNNAVEEAIKNFLVALKSFEQIENKEMQAYACFEIGIAYQQVGNTQEALVFMKNSLGLAQETGIEFLIKKGFQTIADTYEKNNQYKEAFEYLKYFSAIKDTKQISELESQLELADKNKKLELLTKENDFHKKESDTRRMYTIISIIVSIIIFSLSIFLFISLRQRDKINSKLIIATDRANQSKQEKEDFFAYTSHEIRTPLNAVVGMAKLLGETDLDNKQQKYLKTITGSAQNILFLVNDVLDLSKMEKGGIEFEEIEFSLHEIISQIIDSLEFKKFEKKVQLIQKIDKNVPKVMIGDPVRFNQILLNLADNALKFTKEGSVSVSVKTEEQIDDKVKLHFCIEDSGIGIQNDKLQTIFDSYQQEHISTTRQYGGTGLGLAICKLLVENMGGKINVESTPGEGSKFNFSLWMKVSEIKNIEELKQKQIEDGNQLEDINILVVDDNQLNREIFYDLVEDKKNNVRLLLAENGKEAIEILESKNIDLILMDIQMPIMNGYEATKFIRNSTTLSHQKKNIPIIAMTAHVLDGVAEKCVEAGMNDAISKPVNLIVLTQKIKNLIQKDKNHNSKVINQEQETVSSNSHHHINLENLRGITRNKPEKLKKYLDLFIKNVPVDLDKLKQEVLDQNWIETKKTAHKIKGNLNYMGANNISNEIVYLEGLDIENIDKNEIISKLNVVEKEIILILDELSEVKF
jgi:signal transduction histidine kinase/DNA-binding response OmpR family regulator